MNKSYVVVTMVCFFQFASAQSLFMSAGSAWLDATNYAPEATDVFAGANNPSAIPFLQGFSAGAYAEKKYMVSGLAFGKLAAAVSNGNSGAGAFVKYFGNPVYHEWQTAISYAKKLGDVQTGVSFTVQEYAFAGLGRATNLGSGLYTLWKLSGNCVAAIAIVNPPFLRVNSSGTAQAGEYRLAICFEDTPAVAVSAELRMADRSPPSAIISIQYRPASQYVIKAGVISTGPQYFIGLSRQVSHWTLGVALSWHPALGATPGSVFLYQSNPINDQP